MDNFTFLTLLSCFFGLLGSFSGLFAILITSLKLKNMRKEIDADSDKRLRSGLEELRVVSQNDAIEMFNHFMNKGPEAQDPLRDFSFKNF